MDTTGAGTATEQGPFFHGTTARLTVGDLPTAGFPSNYRAEVVMRHVYFTPLRDGAGLAAEVAVELAAQDATPRELTPHVYEVEPLGPFEDDPNVTDKKFPGNPTRSYRSRDPLRVVDGWTRLSPETLQTWRERLGTLRQGENLN